MLKKPLAATLALILTLTGIFPSVHTSLPPFSAQVLEHPALNTIAPGPFRVRVTLPNTLARARLGELGVVVLDEGPDWALVLTDDAQLEALARLRFEPQAGDDLGLLARAAGLDRAWLESSLKPLLAQAEGVRNLQIQLTASDQVATAIVATIDVARADLRAAMYSLTIEQQAAIAALSSVDDDADGLTNTQEQWWCTNPLNPDSDGDGTSDGVEVRAAKDWLGNRRSTYPSTGKPFAGWPPQIPGCRDDDQDSVPDLAERWELGLNINRESTDRDKFDDGQELFGNTYCPGSGGYCGYGALPRNEDWGVIFAEMPSWVKAPGNHPLVAAFPVPEIDVVPSSLHVETVTTVTTDHTITTGTERSYSTAKTEGTSTSVANTTTWNEWEEVAISSPLGTMMTELDPTLHRSGLAPEAIPIVGALALGAKAVWKYCTSGPTRTATCLSIANSALDLAGKGIKFVETLIGPKKQSSAPAGSDPRKDQMDREAGLNLCRPSPPTCTNQATGVGSGSSGQQLTTQNPGSATGEIVKGGGRLVENQGASSTSFSTLYQLAFPSYQPVPTRTETRGRSWGGAQTTTNTRYEEHTITNGEAFSSGESWGTATAVNSSHAADLWFTYKVRNAGTEYAREIANLAFNIYIGDDPNPAITYFVGPDLGGDGKFRNFMPAEQHTYTSRRIPLTLEQMKAVDLGGPVRVVVEDFTYGIDELFYQDAVNSGVLIAIEDGTDDGDELIDTYLIPTWGEETVLDVLTRYFPHITDADGNPIAIWTPEYRADTPAWCVEPRRVGATLWCKHALSTADWWNVYTSGLGDGSEGFQDTPASPGSVALFRFNQDSDLDGYSDRSEGRLGTDPNNPASFPKPELIAGVHSIRVGNQVTATLSLLNTGLYDAYGVEAVLIAPNDTISITNNTVGGSGRVRAQKQVIVGSRILLQSPLPPQWTQSGHARPAVGGYYTGAADRTYTFTVQCSNPAGCNVSSGSWSLTWNDGAGHSGALNFGSGYASPTLQNVGALGVKVGLLSGKVYNGESFTVKARTPRDTFQYTVNREPYTEPVVIVSYNDPQGNHRFVIPPAAMALSSPTADLLAFSGQMLQEPGVEIVTSAAATTGANTTNLVVNNPTDKTLTNARLFLEFVDITGTVVSEVSTTANLPPGPSIVPVNWNTADFSPAYNPAQDYIVMAFLTDYQGNILDTAARPLSSFQADPRPAFAMAGADATWDFGAAQQGTLLKRSFTFANTGALDLLTYVSAPAGLTVSQTGSRRVGPADMTTYEMALNTANLPVGPYDGTVAIRTSDPANPTRTVRVVGNITAAPADTPVGALQRPLDWPATVSGNQGDWVEFTHILGPDPQTLHPVKVYSQDYSILWGVGKYALAFRPLGFASSLGYDGDLFVPNGQIVYVDSVRGVLNQPARVNQKALSVSPQLGISDEMPAANSDLWFRPGDEVLIIQMTGPKSGQYEYAIVDRIDGNVLVTQNGLRNSYDVGPTSVVQALRVPHYRFVSGGGTIVSHPWDGQTGGVIALRALAVIGVTIDASVQGYYGGYGNDSPNAGCGGQSGTQGSSPNGNGGCNRAANGGGGGAGQVGSSGPHWGAGGGGGYGSPGTPGIGNYNGVGGGTYGEHTLSNIYLGAGGGGGAWGTNPYGGGRNTIQGGDNAGRGGGIILITADTISGSNFYSNGGAGGNSNGNYGGYAGGGGAGGSIKLSSINMSSVNTVALGGVGGDGTLGDGGNGGVGRVRIEYCNPPSSVYSNPPASQGQRTDCYIAEQIESAPYNRARLNLPASGANTYQVQYGRRLNWGSGANQVTTLRVPAGLFTSAMLDALISEVGSGSLTFRLDIGNDGSWDWEWTGNVNNAATLNGPNLAAHFNAYWARNGAPTTGTMDVPVRVYLDRAGQVLLTNLQVTPTGSTTRAIRLPVRPQGYNNVTASFTVSGGTGPLAVGVDVGSDGTVDWTYTGSPAYPARLTTGNLAAAINAYLVGKSGEVDVPIRFYLAPFATLTLTGFNATPVGGTDAVLSAGDIAFGVSSPTEGDTVAVTATVRNTGGLDTGPLTASFYATPAGGTPWYIGSAFVGNVAAAGMVSVPLQWNTMGFTGDVPVRVVVDPYNRVAELSETNNVATATLTIKTRPDLKVTQIALSDDEPTAGETVTVTLMLRNHGQTPAGAQTVALYQGNPEAGGTVIGMAVRPLVPAGGTDVAAFTWTVASPGPYRLFARVDRDNAINEYDEGNNEIWRDVYVGLSSPVLLDSGSASDVAYTPARGYGYVDEDQSDTVITCGSQPHETLRLDPNGRVTYRFDHLLPGHFYHLDVTLYECDGAGRQESIYVDGNLIAGPEDLSDGRVRRLSLRLDPALYADRSIIVTVQAPGIDGAVVSAVNLYDIDYRYADAGGGNDPKYPSVTERPYGWLDGVANAAWGVLPYQSVRVDQNDNTLRYRFDRLEAAKSYQLHLTLWQPSGTERIQKVQIDGVDTGTTVNTGNYQVHRIVLEVPRSAYASDGSIVVGIMRINAATGAFVNEIALEELTLTAESVPPVADFTASPTSGYAPLTVRFTDRSSGAVTGRVWHFGDGGTDTLPNPVHTYNTPGIYTASLTVFGPGGSDTLTRTNFITVTGIPPTATVMRISPASASANFGVPITVAISISNVTNLGSFQFTLAYSPSLVTVQNITLGGFPGSTGRSFTPVGPVIDNTSGTATFGAFSIGATPAGASGSGMLAYVRLLPVGGGTASLRLQDVQVTNVPGQAVDVLTQDGTLLITACLGDFDGDGDVDILDVQRIAYRWNTRAGDALYEPAYDLDSDGDIDILDVQRVAYRWGTRCSGATGLGAESSAIQQAASLSVQPAMRTVTAGQVFTVEMVISNAVDLGAFEFTMSYTPTVVEVVTATLGSFPGSTGRAFALAGMVISPTAGTVTFGAYSLGATPQGPSGNGTLAILTLRALVEGQSVLAFRSAQVSDRAGNPQTLATLSNGQVEVRPGYKIYLPLVMRNYP